MVKKWNVTIPKLSGDKPRQAYICLPESYEKNKDKRYRVGIGGVLDYIVPYLNDIYSGWIPKDYWHRCCQRAIIHDKNVYLQLLKRFKNYFANIPYFVDALYSSSSFNKDYWSGDKNKALYREIMEL